MSRPPGYNGQDAFFGYDEDGFFANHNGSLPYHDGFFANHNGSLPYHNGSLPYHDGSLPYHDGFFANHDGFFANHNGFFANHNGFFANHNGHDAFNNQAALIREQAAPICENHNCYAQATFFANHHAQADFINGGQAAFINGGQAAFINGGQAAFTDGGQAAFINGGQDADSGQAAFINGGQAAFTDGCQAAFTDGGQAASIPPKRNHHLDFNVNAQYGHNTYLFTFNKGEDSLHSNMVNAMQTLFLQIGIRFYTEVVCIDSCSLGKKLFPNAEPSGNRLVILVHDESQKLPPLPENISRDQWNNILIITLQGKGKKKMDDMVIAALEFAIYQMVNDGSINDLTDIWLATNDVKRVNSDDEDQRCVRVKRPGKKWCYISIGTGALLLRLTSIRIHWIVDGKHMEDMVTEGLRKYPSISELGKLAKYHAGKTSHSYYRQQDDGKYLYLLLCDMRAFCPSELSCHVSLVNARGLGADAVVSEDMENDLIMVLKKLMPSELVQELHL